MIDLENKKFFDLNLLTIPFNKKINPISIFKIIEKKFSLNEKIRFVIIGYYKFKWNVVLICCTSEKFFIQSNKKKLLINKVFNYSELIKIVYNDKTESMLINLESDDSFELKGIKKSDFIKFKDTLFIQKKIIDEVYISRSEEKSNSYFNEKLDKNYESSDTIEITSAIDNFKDGEKPISKTKRVVNDSVISNSTTFSSIYIFELLTNESTILPNGQKIIWDELVSRIKYLEKINILEQCLDNIPLKISSPNKLNTIPVIVESSSFNNPNQLENKFLFTKNWIEYTKHNVTNKLLGVDENGDGTYIDLKEQISSNVIFNFKAREYKVNDQIRYGLRSGQTISFYGKHQKIGIDSLYFNMKNNQKLDMKKFDGIVFMGQKYYFHVMNEFNSLQKKYCRVFRQERKNNGDLSKSYEIIFDDDLITYNAFNEKGNLIDDLHISSTAYDLKYLNFFKD